MHFHIVLAPVITRLGDLESKPFETLRVTFRDADDRTQHGSACCVEWTRTLEPEQQWANPAVVLGGSPDRVVDDACILAITNRFAKRCPFKMNDPKVLIETILAKQGDQAVWSPALNAYAPIKKLEQDGKKFRALLGEDVLLVVGGVDSESAKRELSRRLLELGHKDPAEMARFLDWMTKGTTEELLEKDAPVIVSLGVLLPRDAAAVKPAGKAKTK